MVRAHFIAAMICALVLTSGARTKIAGVSALPAPSEKSVTASILPISTNAPAASSVPCATEVNRIPPEVTAVILAIAKESGVAKEVLADLYALAKCVATDGEKLADLVAAAKIAGVGHDDLRKLVVLAISNDSGVAPEVLDNLYTLVQCSDTDMAKLIELSKTEAASGIRADHFNTLVVLAIAKDSGVTPEVLINLYALVKCSDADAEKLVEISVAAAVAGVRPEDLRKLMALAMINGGFKSRFDILSPSYFSRMWAVKMKALDAEKAGKNTDELWKMYWNLFAADVFAEEIKED